MCTVNTDLISGLTLNQPFMSLYKVCTPEGKVVCITAEMKDFKELERKASCTHYTHLQTPPHQKIPDRSSWTCY